MTEVRLNNFSEHYLCVMSLRSVGELFFRDYDGQDRGLTLQVITSIIDYIVHYNLLFNYTLVITL